LSKAKRYLRSAEVLAEDAILILPLPACTLPCFILQKRFFRHVACHFPAITL
jgi:hypothetical protein